jgi:hypothetical protein
MKSLVCPSSQNPKPSSCIRRMGEKSIVDQGNVDIGATGTRGVEELLG